MSQVEQYDITIIRRNFQGQTRDDYHATVVRRSDKLALVFISDWRWVLALKLCRWNLNREFKWHDKHKAKLERKETITK